MPPHDAPAHIRTIKEWICACDKLHGDTCVPSPISQRPPHEVPTWVIDTTQHCLVAGSSADQYLALSYVWADNRAVPDAQQQSLLLNEKSRSDLERPGFLSSERALRAIPDVVKYAIGFTISLGERYLWVDRLCVMQNDGHARDEEVMRMDKIYGGTYVTLIAAAPESMFSRGTDFEWAFFPMRSGFALHLESAIENRYRHLVDSKLSTRGWIYQEQILCKRAAVLLEHGFFWDCQCNLWDGSNLCPNEVESHSSPLVEMGRRFSSRWWPDFGFYMDLMCSYNRRQFTYPQDTLNAFSGILNALSPVFPGGFACGLPCLFLDHALLWQPFGRATRRLDRPKRDEFQDLKTSSLPSWSWCGWECFVDPWSLLSGLAYIDEDKTNKRSGSWSTRNFVQWKISNGGLSSGKAVQEPRTFDMCANMRTAIDAQAPCGWKRHLSADQDVYFTHEKDSHARFKHPVPLNEGCSTSNLSETPSYLSCKISTVSLLRAAILRPIGLHRLLAGMKISAFQHKVFQEGPESGHCSVLVLQLRDGRFAGLLRLMGGDQDLGEGGIDLCAISRGSANRDDLCSSFEWKVFEKRYVKYRMDMDTCVYAPSVASPKGRIALSFDIMMAFRGEVAANVLDMETDRAECHCKEKGLPECHCEEKDLSECHCKEKNAIEHERAQREGVLGKRYECSICALFGRSQRTEMLEERRRRRYSFSSPEMGLCEFYNVLWVEYKDGIAYRRACGWVPKHIWEANASDPVEITLG